MMNPRSVIIAFCAIAALIFLSGCGAGAVLPATRSGAASDNLRAHHGGIVAPLDDGFAELCLDAQASQINLFVTDRNGQPRPISAEYLPFQATFADETPNAVASLIPHPLSGESLGGASRFQCSTGRLSATVPCSIAVRIPLGGKCVRTIFCVSPPPCHHAAAFRCPMDCQHGKIFATPGACPACGMALVEFKDGRLAHGDHTPKHGGIFFMSADNFHHVEGVRASPTEFDLYVYDNFTQPLNASDFAASAEISFSPDRTQRIDMDTRADGACLRAQSPEWAKAPPSAIAVRIVLNSGQPAELFNFSFDQR